MVRVKALRRLYYPKSGGRDYRAGETLEVQGGRELRMMMLRKLVAPADTAAAAPLENRAMVAASSGQAEGGVAPRRGKGGRYGRRDMRAED